VFRTRWDSLSSSIPDAAARAAAGQHRPTMQQTTQKNDRDARMTTSFGNFHASLCGHAGHPLRASFRARPKEVISPFVRRGQLAWTVRR
jgi:hypothetical protein